MDVGKLSKLCTLLAKIVYETGISTATDGSNPEPELLAVMKDMGIDARLEHGTGYRVGDHCVRVYLMNQSANRKGLAERARRKIINVHEVNGEILYDAVVIINNKRPPNFNCTWEGRGFLITNVI